jgi:hypothetical protein
MKVSELQTLINNEVAKSVKTEVARVLKVELPKMVKPMVQEAVAGALANLLAEGIVNGPPAPKTRVLTPNIPQAKAPVKSGGQPVRQTPGLNDVAKRSLAEKMGYGAIDRIGTPADGFMSTGDITADILNETAMQMAGSMDSGPPVTSILDVADNLGDAASPEAVEALTRDYSDLMKAMERRGKING